MAHRHSEKTVAANSRLLRLDEIQQPEVSIDTKKALKDLLNLAATLSKDRAIVDILSYIDQVPTLQREIRRLDERAILDEKTRDRMLDLYNRERDKWQIEKQDLSGQASGL
jgi:hypothetical protein